MPPSQSGFELVLFRCLKRLGEQRVPFPQEKGYFSGHCIKAVKVGRFFGSDRPRAESNNTHVAPLSGTSKERLWCHNWPHFPWAWHGTCGRWGWPRWLLPGGCQYPFLCTYYNFDMKARGVDLTDCRAAVLTLWLMRESSNRRIHERRRHSHLINSHGAKRGTSIIIHWTLLSTLQSLQDLSMYYNVESRNQYYNVETNHFSIPLYLIGYNRKRVLTDKM